MPERRRWKGEAVAGVATATGFLHHLRTCNNARLPGDRLPFRIGSAQVGWVKPALAAVLAKFPGISADASGITLADGERLPSIARQLVQDGHFRFRREDFDIRAELDGEVVARLDRGALPSFGVLAEGVHVNGLVRRSDGVHVWVARRAADKQLDPGKLDHIVAGGVPAGLSPAETLVKEAEEEAAIPASLASQAVPVARIAYAMERPEGLRRDRLHCYDLDLPADFTPRAADGEVEAFELWPIARVVQTVRDTDLFKFNVNLVLIDLFLREHLIVGREAEELRAGLCGETA
jgi:8-oxo-dGTP pyrophosphatase MutT (NUDIX family)